MHEARAIAVEELVFHLRKDAVLLFVKEEFWPLVGQSSRLHEHEVDFRKRLFLQSTYGLWKETAG